VSLALASTSSRAADFDLTAMRLVVSVRKFTPEDKPSYHRLVLYSGDGKVVRPLTNAAGANDFNPVFSPDGKQVIFKRAIRRPKDPSQNGYYRIDDLKNPKAVKLADQKALPAWFHPEEDLKRVEEQGTPDHGTNGISEDTSTTRYSTPDGKQTLETHYYWPSEAGKTDDAGASAIESTMWLRDQGTSVILRVSTFPGFEGVSGLWQVGKSPFFIRTPMRVAFLRCHRGSSYGESIHALDLNRRVIHLMTWAGYGSIVPAPGDLPAFFCICQERYQDLGNGHTTVNCEYLDLWNSDFKRTRFAPPISAFGGASVLIPGQPLLTIPIADEK
jgi:hypothetical protein